MPPLISTDTYSIIELDSLEEELNADGELSVVYSKEQLPRVSTCSLTNALF